ncbi:hypothetical protein NMY22_g20139 [Coprinellus aureogranulatus]|nr:hypothetical protein NMY22_g20139 [Coprinellus aureogranulatus]
MSTPSVYDQPMSSVPRPNDHLAVLLPKHLWKPDSDSDSQSCCRGTSSTHPSFAHPTPTVSLRPSPNSSIHSPNQPQTQTLPSNLLEMESEQEEKEEEEEEEEEKGEEEAGRKRRRFITDGSSDKGLQAVLVKKKGQNEDESVIRRYAFLPSLPPFSLFSPSPSPLPLPLLSTLYLEGED